tara:strand:- start:1488 stop:6626 length:5139 start_codon:yes stop_codon:yes gene_type:complete
MKHIDKKTRFAGANFSKNIPNSRGSQGAAGTAGAGDGGGGPVFRPPKLGEMQYGASYSFLETLDLISDGPIQGLVNKNGEVVNGKDMLQGVYLNESPVAVSTPLNNQSANVEDNSTIVADITGGIPVTEMFGHFSSSNSNDLIFNPEGQLVNFTGKAGVVAPNWAAMNSATDGDVHDASSTSDTPNGFIYGSIALLEDNDNKLVASTVSVKNDFPRFGLYMGDQDENYNENVEVTLVNQSGVNSIVEIDPSQENRFNGKRKAASKSYLIYSDLENISKSINTVDGAGNDSGTITFNNGVYTLTNTNTSAFIQETSNTNIVEGRVYRVEFTIFDYSSGAIKVRHPFTSDIVSGNGTFSFTAKAVSSGGDAEKLLFLIETATANFKIKDIFIYDVTDSAIPTNYKSLVAFGNNPGKALNFRDNQPNKWHENEKLTSHFFGTKSASDEKKSSSSKLAQILSKEFIELSQLRIAASNQIDAGGKYQKDLVDKAFNNLGDRLTESITTSIDVKDWKNCFKKFLESLDKDLFVVYRPIKKQAGLNFSILDPEGIKEKVEEFEYQSLIDYSFTFDTSFNQNITALANLNSDIEVYDFLVPKIGLDGVLTQEVNGFYLFAIKASSSESSIQKDRGKQRKYSFKSFRKGISTKIVDDIKDISSLKYKPTANSSFSLDSAQKFNYSNVLAELKLGTENQSPFKFFNKIYIDKPYDSFLYGPFITDKNLNVQRIVTNNKLLSESTFDINTPEGQREGSIDVRTGTALADDKTNFLNYSNWADALNPSFDEPSSPITHTVYNPNVEEIFVSLDIKNLRDTLHTEVKPDALKEEEDEADRKMSAGVHYPALLEIRVSTGLIDPKTNKKTPNGEIRDYHFVALVNASVLVDLGNPENSPTDFPWVKLNSFQDSAVETNKINTPIKLPPAIRIGAAGVGEGNEEVPHRYVEIEKISCETNSVLLSRNVSLSKVTEIIAVNLSYPFSAIVGTKLDSRSIDGVPERNFDCKLKLIKIPSNYNPTEVNGKDKRYYSSEDEFNNTSENNKRIYVGDWDGTFNKELQWTDNPAWILYDLLTNKRYGLGQHVDESTINIWELYKIGRFCDAVNEEGLFVGVSDGQGGLEPRFACNIMFSNNEKIYDAIYTIAALFRGSIFFGDKQINFVDDRPRVPISVITNESIKGGMFNYSNNRRDEIYNTVEITYNDRFDDFLPKIETVEDEEDIRRRGVFKTRIQGVGMTSRGMARRAASHLLFHTVNENQTITFQAGLSSLLYRPGDIIQVEDELKSNLINFGRVLAVDADKQEIRISNTFDDTQMSGKLTIYNPTGIDSISDLNNVSQVNRQRKLGGFNISGDVSSTSSTATWTNNFKGNYDFSGYRQGYTGTEGGFEEYATYTGTGSNILYFDTSLTGWVYATGNSFERNNTFAKFISLSTDINNNSYLQNFSTGDLNNYDTSASDNRGSNIFTGKHVFSGNLSNSELGFTNGVLESEISVTSPTQIDVISLTADPINQAYGTLVSGVEASKTGLLQNIKLGSTCSFEKSGASPITFKVLEIAEVNPNEFATVATLYDSGKYDLIENDKSIVKLSNTFSYQNASSRVNQLTYHNLSPVRSLTFSTGDVPELNEFLISGSWTDPNGSNATGYLAEISVDGINSTDPQSTENTFVVFSGIDEQFGTYSLRVKALAGGADNSSVLNAYYDSSFSIKNQFLIPSESVVYNKSFLDDFTIN